jgi:hypothetical protein
MVGRASHKVDPGQEGNAPKAIWKEQVMIIYFQIINGPQLRNEGADMLDLLLQMENIQAHILASPKSNWPPINCTSTISYNRRYTRFGTMQDLSTALARWCSKAITSQEAP